MAIGRETESFAPSPRRSIKVDDGQYFVASLLAADALALRTSQFS